MLLQAMQYSNGPEEVNQVLEAADWLTASSSDVELQQVSLITDILEEAVSDEVMSTLPDPIQVYSQY